MLLKQAAVATWQAELQVLRVARVVLKTLAVLLQAPPLPLPLPLLLLVLLLPVQLKLRVPVAWATWWHLRSPPASAGMTRKCWLQRQLWNCWHAAQYAKAYQ